MTFVIVEECVDVKDKTCLDVCPVDCIYEGPRSLYINPDECIDCAACEPVCPVEAIYKEEELPAEYLHYKEVNAEFFTETTSLGNPGSALEVGRQDVDHPRVAELPQRSPAQI
ncbi:MAG TPA: ferredoxin [Streptosporangiaceae bacterium]|nr:ferredoxin [Streptosporangiaceae bacterium]